MILITIEVKNSVMVCHEGKIPKSRLVWVAAGLEVYVLGPLAPGTYDQAANLAMNYAEGVNIPASWLRRYIRPSDKLVERPTLISSEGVSLRKKLL